MVYKFRDKYFYLDECYGSCSGCDDWDSNSLASHTNIVDGFKEDIENNL